MPCMPGVFVGASPLVLAPPNPPLWSSVLCEAALTVVFNSVAFPCPWFSSTGIWALSSLPLSWRPHVDFLCSRGDRLCHQASAWCLSEGLPLSFSSSVFVTHVVSCSSGLEFIADDPPALQNSNSHSVAGVATFSDGPALPLLLQYTGNLASVMLFTLPLGALSRFSGACVLLTMPHLALRSTQVCSGSPRLRWVPGHTGVRLLSTPTPSRSLPTWVSPLALRPRHSTDGFPVKSILVFTVPFVTGSLPVCLTCMASLLTLSLATSSLSCLRGLARWDNSSRPSLSSPAGPFHLPLLP